MTYQHWWHFHYVWHCLNKCQRFWLVEMAFMWPPRYAGATSIVYTIWLSHPSLGWLYVFSLFPPPRPRPRRPPQWLLLLTSKRFELDLTYLGQRMYRSEKMYWMTFGWPWPKVMAVTLINTNLFVCRIKWELINQSLQNVAAIFIWSWS